MEEGLSLRQAKKELAAQEKRRELEREDPAEYQFQCLLELLRVAVPKALREGDVYFGDLITSPTPLFGWDMTAAQWVRFKVIVQDWVPWNSSAQKDAFDQHFRESSEPLHRSFSLALLRP